MEQSWQTQTASSRDENGRSKAEKVQAMQRAHFTTVETTPTAISDYVNLAPITLARVDRLGIMRIAVVMFSAMCSRNVCFVPLPLFENSYVNLSVERWRRHRARCYDCRRSRLPCAAGLRCLYPAKPASSGDPRPPSLFRGSLRAMVLVFTSLSSPISKVGGFT